MRESALFFLDFEALWMVSASRDFRRFVEEGVEEVEEDGMGKDDADVERGFGKGSDDDVSDLEPEPPVSSLWTSSSRLAELFDDLFFSEKFLIESWIRLLLEDDKVEEGEGEDLKPISVA